MARAGQAIHVHQFMSSVGDGTGVRNIILDYRDPSDGIGATDYFYQPAALEVVEVSRIMITIGDAKATLIDGDGYGGGVALSNGITLKLTESDGTLIQWLGHTDVEPIKENWQWAALCYDFTEHPAATAGSNFAFYRWTFKKANTFLELTDRDKLVLTVNDNLSVLEHHYFNVQGKKKTVTAGEAGRYSKRELGGLV